jgi:uncharacterized protein YndB with AHSA1/START domain
MHLANEAEAIEREVRNEERSGRPARVILARRFYPAAVEDVWDALTNAERLPRWFLPVTGDLSVGGRYQFEGNAGGEILDCKRPHWAELTWEFGGEVSWLQLRLSEGEGGTHLELEHTAHVPPEFWTEFGPGAGGVGWDLAFLGLANHLAGGPDVSEADEADLLASEEGRAYAQSSSDAWVAASIASGEDPEAARASGERTFAFYVGSG